jgi:hypothetical protein
MNLPLCPIARQELEEYWRQKVQEAWERYQIATAWYKELQKAKHEGRVHTKDDPLTLARQAQSETLAEYARVLKSFTELTVDNRLASNQPQVLTEGEVA